MVSVKTLHLVEAPCEENVRFLLKIRGSLPQIRTEQALLDLAKSMGVRPSMSPSVKTKASNYTEVFAKFSGPVNRLLTLGETLFDGNVVSIVRMRDSGV